MENYQSQEEGTKSYGECIRELRKEQGISLETLAKACTLSPETLQSIEEGKHIPDKSIMGWISNRLGVYGDDLQNGIIRKKLDYEQSANMLQHLESSLKTANNNLAVVTQFVNQHHIAKANPSVERPVESMDYINLDGKHGEWDRMEEVQGIMNGLNAEKVEYTEDNLAREEQHDLYHREEQGPYIDSESEERYAVYPEAEYAQMTDRSVEAESPDRPREEIVNDSDRNLSDLYVIVDTKTGKALTDKEELLLFKDLDEAKTYADILNKREIALEHTLEKVQDLTVNPTI